MWASGSRGCLLFSWEEQSPQVIGQYADDLFCLLPYGFLFHGAKIIFFYGKLEFDNGKCIGVFSGI